MAGKNKWHYSCYLAYSRSWRSNLIYPFFPFQLTIDHREFLENLFSILRFEADRNVAKLRKPVDKDKWATEPAVVNAFYNPNKNDIGTNTVFENHRKSRIQHCERSEVLLHFLNGRKFIKNAKMVNFGDFLKTWSLWSNSVTRQIIFNWTKIDGKCQNSNI